MEEILPLTFYCFVGDIFSQNFGKLQNENLLEAEPSPRLFIVKIG